MVTKRKDPKDYNYKNCGPKFPYNDDLAEEICIKIATNPVGLQTLCKANPHWPSRETIFKWMSIYPVFADKYAKAKEHQIETSVDFLNAVLEEDHHFEDDTGRRRVDANLLRIKVDAIKWQAGKLKRKKYGETREIEENKNEDLHQEAMEHERKLIAKNKKEF